MVIVNVVYVDVRVTFDRRGDGLVPSRIKDGRGQVVHASGIWVGLGLSTENGRIQNDVGDIVQDVFLDLNEIRLSEDDDLDWFDRLAGGVFDVLDLGNDPNHINVRHRLAHQTRHDTETSNLDFDLPIDDLVFEGGDQNLSSLFLILGPTDNLRLLMARETELLSDGPAIVVILAD
jgi:hypothetical protein